MAGRRNKFAKRRREPSTPTSRKRSRRQCGSDFLQESALETPDKEVAVDQLTVSVRSLGIVDTPKSSRSRRRGVRPQLTGRVLFKEEQDTSKGTRTLPEWSDEEFEALCSFLMLYTDGKSWPAHKDYRFWKQAGLFIQQRSKTSYCRSGKACRVKVCHKLRQKFKSPAAAEKHYVLQREAEVQSQQVSPSPSLPVCSPDQALLPVPTPSQQLVPYPNTVPQATSVCQEALAGLQPSEQAAVLSELFSAYLRHCNIQAVEPDFLELAARGMQHLHEKGRTNVIYSMVKAVGTMRSDGSDSLLPAERMPMGLIEYAVNFFTASSVQKLSCPPDYRSWQQTMYILFGTKWTKIFNGPMWSHSPTMQGEDSAPNPVANPMSPINALVNVPGLSDRTLRRDIAKSDITIASEIQTTIIQSATTSDPNAWWWIKADGVDVVKGLCESTKGEWSGDVDLNDGQLQLLHQQLHDRLEWIKGIGMKERSAREVIKSDLLASINNSSTDLQFIHSELQKSNSTYEDNIKEGKATDKTMFSLSWDIEELKKLLSDCRSLCVEMSAVLDAVSNADIDLQQYNLPRKLSSIRERLSNLVKGLTRFKRQPATHIFVMMISSEHRNCKPYAVPVQCIPYAGLNEDNLRRLVTELVKEMVDNGMKVAGFVSDGEFNYMRSKGYTRPLSVLQIRTNVRTKYNKLHQRTLLAMLTPKRLPDGTIVAKHPNPAVPPSILLEISNWVVQGASLEDAVDRLRSRTVPAGYNFHTWQSGKSESFTQKLRSILAQFEFAHEVRKWQAKGVPFQTHLYVPEIHPVTQMPFCEREDEAHVLKRIASHTRSGGPDKLQLERFVEALSDPSSGLTYPALTGARKQSVVDAERLFNPDLTAFMRQKEYEYEARYTEIIWNWRRSCDERGLSELQRCRFNYQFLNLILEDLMPWYKQQYDFSLLEVNRDLNNVLGFSKETLVAVVTNIEGREWRRREGVNSARQPEHPRASSTDDVECFFSVLRDTIGRNFTTKQVRFGFRKACVEFKKRLDPDLPFYYHTSSHDRFYEGPLPDFSVSNPKKKRKFRTAPRREQPAAFAPRRATMPVRGSLSVRPQFHNLPLELPPIPTDQIHVLEHSYV